MTLAETNTISKSVRLITSCRCEAVFFNSFFSWVYLISLNQVIVTSWVINYLVLNYQWIGSFLISHFLKHCGLCALLRRKWSFLSHIRLLRTILLIILWKLFCHHKFSPFKQTVFSGNAWKIGSYNCSKKFLVQHKQIF